MFGPDSKTNTIYLGSGPLMVVNGQTNKVTASDPSAGLGYGEEAAEVIYRARGLRHT